MAGFLSSLCNSSWPSDSIIVCFFWYFTDRLPHTLISHLITTLDIVEITFLGNYRTLYTVCGVCSTVKDTCKLLMLVGVTNLYFCPTASEKVLLNMTRWEHICTSYKCHLLEQPIWGPTTEYILLCTCNWITTQTVAKSQWYPQSFGFNIFFVKAVTDNTKANALFCIQSSRTHISNSRPPVLTCIFRFPQFPREMMA
jgi:hypothetical protein